MKERNYGLDLIKIIAMFLVVMIHVLTYGGVLNNVQPGSVNYYAAWYMESVSYICIDLFGLASGYLGASHSFRTSSVLKRWLQVFFYTGPLALLMYISGRGGSSNLINGLFPVFTNYYWYFTQYFVLCFFIPVIQLAMNHISRKNAEKLIASIVLVLSFYPCVSKYDMFYLSNGYSAGWLMALYVLGFYFGKYGYKKAISFRMAAVLNFLIAALNCWSAVHYMQAEGQKPIMLLDYTSPTVLLGAILLLNGALHLKFKDHFKKVIRMAVPYSFGVYLFNEQQWLRQYFLMNRLIFLKDQNVFIMITGVLAAVLVIYLLGTFTDWIRSVIFKRIKVNAFTDRISQKGSDLINRFYDKCSLSAPQTSRSSIEK